MNKTITKETLLNLIYEEGAEKIDEFATKHDCHVEVWVVPLEGKFWQVSFESSYNYGVEEDSFDLAEVESYEVVEKHWRVKK